MKRDATKILRDALDLPPEARAALAGLLIDSLDDQVDEGAEEAWATEIIRRLAEIDSGKVKLVSWPEARRRLTSRSARLLGSNSSPKRLKRWLRQSDGTGSAVTGQGKLSVWKSSASRPPAVGEAPGW
ncbi:MAG TPA: addiction module protein [Longimicrobiaceae bacterium]|nr:addiction module protein [Longimicrobiaceae bacterium]